MCSEDGHGVELDGECLVGFVDRLSRRCGADAPRVDAAVAGVEEDGDVAFGGGGGEECFAGAGGEA